ncbi:PAS domain S-box protein [Flavisolibacter ginsenosidimutans]|uniref:PAS domain S-box protein n=1 Tax=Flavisolibacter ginsenosidimutans TaxID=661481 RepID=A0A5B8UK99_9BACT|nr:PAS domain S-box protein [Flavisolibacter ginsenosidimutans]QEC57104.1 PAS domain S-box protein [Flavisolibacter ginsenosidimutans]
MQDEEIRMFALFEMTPDLVCIVNKEGYFLKINPAVSQKLGYTEAELKAVPVSTFIHPDDRELTAGKRAKLLNNHPLLNFQNRYLTKGCETVWLEWTSIYLPAKEIVFAIAKDITVHKQKERELQENYARFRQLATHFKNHIENDREQMATGLHEDLAQLATAVKMETEWLSAQALSPLLAGRLEKLSQTTNRLVNNIRRIAYSFGHANIADLGLDDALESLCTEFSALTGIRCRYKSSFSETVLSYEIKLDIYRVCQEALLNIMQHAEASLVTVCLKHDGSRCLQLSIADNGKGFDLQATAPATGLANMRGRALSINGHLSITSNKEGTTVELAIASASLFSDHHNSKEHRYSDA